MVLDIIKRAFLIVVFLAFSIPAHADLKSWLGSDSLDEYFASDSVDEVLGVAIASGASDCPSGTYVLYYNGDHSSGTGYACLTSGGSAANGTTNGSITLSTAKILIEGINSYITWDATIPADGTLCLTATFLDNDENADLDNNTLAEFYGDSNDYLVLRSNDATDSINAYYTGNGTADNTAGQGSLSNDTKYRVCVSWSTTAANPDFSVSAVAYGNAVSWQDDDDDLVEWDTAPTAIIIGPKNFAYATDYVEIEDVILMSGYKATDPL